VTFTALTLYASGYRLLIISATSLVAVKSVTGMREFVPGRGLNTSGRHSLSVSGVFEVAACWLLAVQVLRQPAHLVKPFVTRLLADLVLETLAHLMDLTGHERARVE